MTDPDSFTRSIWKTTLHATMSLRAALASELEKAKLEGRNPRKNFPDTRSSGAVIAMLHLGVYGPATMSELSTAMGITPAGVTGIVDGCEFLGVAARRTWGELSESDKQKVMESIGNVGLTTAPNSRNKIYLVLTQKGYDLIRNLNRGK